MKSLRSKLVRLAYARPDLRSDLLPLILTASDQSTHPVVVEYAVRNLFKRMSVEKAAKVTAENLSGGTNTFIESGSVVVNIDPKRLEEALFERMAKYTLDFIGKVRPGKEDFAFLGTVDHFKLNKKDQKVLKALVEKLWGQKLPGA